MGGVRGFFWGVWVVFLGGVHGFSGGCAWFFLGGVCMVFSRGHAWFFLGGACVGYDELRSMSGRCASYWNAFLLICWILRRWHYTIKCCLVCEHHKYMDFNVLRATISGNSTTSRWLNYFPFILQTNFNQSVTLKTTNVTWTMNHALVLLVFVMCINNALCLQVWNIKTWR